MQGLSTPRGKRDDDERLWSVDEAATRAGLPVRTVRRYLSRHGGFIDSRVLRRSKMLSASGLAALARIRELYAAGHRGPDVDRVLARDGGRYAVAPGEADGAGQSAAEAFLDLRGELAGLRRQVGLVAERMAERDASMVEEFAKIRAALRRLLQALQTQETERRRSDADWKRQEAERLRAVLSAELSAHGAKKTRR